MVGTVSIYTLCLAIAALLSCVLAEVNLLKVTQTIYDSSPKLLIRGSGFDANDHDIVLELGASGQPLTGNKDYLLTKDPDGDGLILKLLANRKWVALSERNPPVALILSAVKFGADSTKNLLPDPYIVAQVLSTPSVKEVNNGIYSSATNELRINGTGFMGAKKVDFYFQPPLYKEVAYEDVSRYPLQSDQVVLRLRHSYKWRDDAGPLSVMGVDTGGGPVRLNGDYGVKIFENLNTHVSVEDTAAKQLIYNDEANVMITGTGFNSVGNTLRFANGILGNNVNYTTKLTSETSITLRLISGSYWRKSSDNLPGALALFAINVGDGYVSLGPINGKGQDVATVFERPTVYSGNKKLYRTHSHELHVKGAGFPAANSGYKPLLKLAPELIVDVDYTVQVIDRTEIEITLLDGHAWRSEAGPLKITAINTRGDDAGWVTLPDGGVHIAEIEEDLDAVVTGGVEVFPMGVKVYQSALNQVIQITGTGFREGMSFVFDPPMSVNSDYDLKVESKNRVTLYLRSGKKWRADPGFIIAKSVKIDGKTYNLAGTEGIRVAVVLADPVVSPSKDTYHESQSKLVVISGSGFTNVADTKVVVRPAAPGAYKILGVLEDAIRVQLKPDMDWLPSFMSLKDEDESKRVAMQVSSIDTGAGEITFPEPITIGFIVKDREGVTCDDSCEFAFDGVCDDGTEPNDDLGGFYGEPEDWDGDGITYGVAYDRKPKGLACVKGTDCTDCGGVDAIIDYNRPIDPDSGYESCTNTCIYPRDGVCDDPRGTKYCELGTDCQDCGPVGADNFTRSDDDDDDGWMSDNSAGVVSAPVTISEDNTGDVDESEPSFMAMLSDHEVSIATVFGVVSVLLFIFVMVAM